MSPTLSQLYWATSDNRGVAVSEEVFGACKVVVFGQAEWVEKQAVLSHVSAPIVADERRDKWQDHDYNREALLSKGFALSTEPTMVVVDDGAGRFAVKYIYWPLEEAPEMLALADAVYGDRVLKARGLSDFGKRGGTKGEGGSMVMFGSHNLIPGPTHGITQSIPAVYRFNDSPNAKLNALVTRHVDTLTECERGMIPALAAKRDLLAEENDPDRLHRMSETCTAFSASLARNYVVTAHDDSGEAAETILFVNKNGPLPEGHTWDFAVGGHVHPLPTEVGKAVLLFVEGSGVLHGTLPTSATEPTFEHGNFGSALVTKRDMIRSLQRQRERGETTPKEWTASALYVVESSKNKYLVDDELNVVFTPTMADVLHDFRALCRTSSDEMVSFGAFTDRGTGCPMPKPLFSYRRLQRGQLLSECFHHGHRLASTAKGKPSANELLQKWKRDPKLMEQGLARVHQGSRTVAAKRYWLLSKDSGLYTCTHFRAIVSYDLCKVMYARKVLDACGGWGDRLTGFLASSSVEDIVIVEPRAGGIQGYERQVALVRPAKSVKTKCGTAEAVLPTLTELFDLIVTSPPYWNLETYCDANGSAVAHHPTLDAFKTTMLQPMLQQMARLLREGGLLAINVDDNPKQGVHLCQYTLDTLRAAGLTFVCTAGLTKPAKFEKDATGGRAEPIYLFTKGAKPTYRDTDIIPVRFGSLYGTSLLGKRLRI